MDNLGMGTNSLEQTTELYLKKILAGNIKTVRRQLIDAMESLGYDIIEEEPYIIGRRGAINWATWFASADVLDYATTLTIRLKPIGDNSTRVTFDYLIKHGMLSQGEKNIVVQEAKTIAAISKTHAVEKMCSVCETESTDDSKFCRRCGAPLTSEQAELEVLRMMAETRAGKTSVVASSISMILSVILLAVVFILNNAELIKPKLFLILLTFGGLGMLAAIIFSFFGWNRLKRALEKPEDLVQSVPQRIPKALVMSEHHELLPQLEPASVTEETTNLLDQEWTNRRQEEKVPVSARGKTNNLD